MALPVSGSLSIKNAAGNDRSIAYCVDGNITGDKSLSTLSVSAGKSAPHAMTEFYGYTDNTCFCFGTCVSTVSCATRQAAYVPVCMYNRSGVVTVNMCATFSLSKLQTGCVWTRENGGIVATKRTSTGGFTQTGIDTDDTLCVGMDLCDQNFPEPLLGDIGVCLCPTPATWTSGSGTAVRCSPYDCFVIVFPA